MVNDIEIKINKIIDSNFTIWRFWFLFDELIKYATSNWIEVKMVNFTDKWIEYWIIVKEPNNKYIIYLNCWNSYIINKFVIAHLLWHYYLHLLQDEKILWYKETILSFCKIEWQENIVEKEANEFAINLLMPKEYLIEEYNILRSLYSFKDSSLILADLFWVSIQSMKDRLYSLNLNY